MDKEANGPPQAGLDPFTNIDEGISTTNNLLEDSIPVVDNVTDNDEAQVVDSLEVVDSPEDKTDTSYKYSEADDRPVSGGNPLVLGLTIALVFILGLALGFFGRPVILKDLPIEVVVTVVPSESQALAQANPPVNESTNSGSGVSEGRDEATAGQPTPTIMDFVLSDARHFQGDEAAPVTIIEFSDFN